MKFSFSKTKIIIVLYKLEKEQLNIWSSPTCKEASYHTDLGVIVYANYNTISTDTLTKFLYTYVKKCHA